MCTAACFKDKDCYFGRNLDYEFSYGEQIVVTPRNFEYGFRYTDEPSYKYAIIGMAHVSDGYPLYYDAMNEKGLGMAGLNFVGNAYFNPVVENKTNVCSFEFIPWILCQCETVEEAIHLINEMNLCDTPFSESFPPASLHYMISDSNKTITVEIMKDGVHIYDNPVGVLTNNPPFDKQMFNLNNYMYLSTKQPENTFSKDVNLSTYSRGMGALGLPGRSFCQALCRNIRKYCLQSGFPARSICSMIPGIRISVPSHTASTSISFPLKVFYLQGLGDPVRFLLMIPMNSSISLSLIAICIPCPPRT